MNAIPAKIKSQRSEAVNSPREIRVAYPYFHEKRTKNAAGVPFVFGADHPKAGQPNPRYSGALMFPKLANDPAQCANYGFLWGLAVEAARKMWPQNVDTAGNWIWPVGAALPIQDGDVPYVSKPKPGVVPKTPEQLAAANAWRRGYWLIEAENFLDPGPQIGKIVGGVPAAVAAEAINGVVQYKSGDWGFPNIHAYAYQNKTFGVGFGFDGFCFTREGDPIGSTGPRPVDQMFAGIPVVASPPTAPAPGGAPALPLPVAAPTAPSAPVGPGPIPTASVAPVSSAPPMPPMAAAAPPLPIPGR